MEKNPLSSKTVIAGVLIAVVTIVQAYITIPAELLTALYSILGAFGVYGVRNAIDGIGKK